MTKYIDAIDNSGKPCNYISQINNLRIEDFDNVNLNKVTTGSGFTSFILKSNIKYILTVPFIPLIENKEKWCRDRKIDILSVYGLNAGGASNAEILAYRGDKILCTWDSLKRLTKTLGDKVNEWRLCIDEAHKITDAGAFRTDAILDLIELSPLYKAITMGTATPVADECLPEAFKKLQKVQIKWHNLELVNINYYMYEQEKLHAIGSLVGMNHILGITEGTAHIFLNSVQGIIKIVKLMSSNDKFDKSKINIVVADNRKNKEALKQSKLGLTISSVNKKSNVVNFYTSMAFEGVDIFSETGKTYLISDSSHNFSKLNILTQLPQIINRVRDSIYRNQVEFFYSPNMYYSSVTKEEFKDAMYKNLGEADKLLNEFNRQVKHNVDAGFNTDIIIKGFRLNIENNPFILEREKGFILNDLACKNELHNYDTIHKLYYVPSRIKEMEVKGKVKKVKEYAMSRDTTIKHNDITYSYKAQKQQELKGLNQKIATGKVPFIDLCTEYILLKSNTYTIDTRIETIEQLEPTIKEAYDKLGASKMKALKYCKANLQKELIKSNQVKNNAWKISKTLNFSTGDWVATSTLKAKLQSTYDSLLINKRAKATDINEFYDTSKKSKRVNGKVTEGFNIVFNKYK